MNQTEKDQLLKQAHQMLKPEFENREEELRQRHGEELEKIKADGNRRLDQWSREFSQAENQERHRLTVAAAGLALAVARKIIRDTAQVDPEFVTRTLETALYKIQDNSSLTVTVHPDDAAFLAENPDLREKLRLGTVVPDRRVEKGGCRLESGCCEWDATLSHQLETLAEIVEESLAEMRGENGPRLD